MTFRTRLVQIAATALLCFGGTPWVVNAQEAAHLKGLTAIVVHVNPIVSPVGTFKCR